MTQFGNMLCECGHTRRPKHDPGAYWNADQRAVHFGCEPPCACTHFKARDVFDLVDNPDPAD